MQHIGARPERRSVNRGRDVSVSGDPSSGSCTVEACWFSRRCSGAFLPMKLHSPRRALGHPLQLRRAGVSSTELPSTRPSLLAFHCICGFSLCSSCGRTASPFHCLVPRSAPWTVDLTAVHAWLHSRPGANFWGTLPSARAGAADQRSRLFFFNCFVLIQISNLSSLSI